MKLIVKYFIQELVKEKGDFLKRIAVGLCCFAGVASIGKFQLSLFNQCIHHSPRFIVWGYPQGKSD
ncbi:hypothetical protein CWB99_10350 [Pseudoalteromonas rubra]|uniref:Uncharacterized protein n=1 Tax=Pseudoalteromonas rubra TaxID=43658 RepID=A0A5S3WMF0_9GAMM|nr:hypothetical protein CWC00_23725 [Pseudoalteromonas rubra]TMP29160.1 hypothetical protein CWB99_10350 [Pseudoalteromonas rubra]